MRTIMIGLGTGLLVGCATFQPDAPCYELVPEEVVDTVHEIRMYRVRLHPKGTMSFSTDDPLGGAPAQWYARQDSLHLRIDGGAWGYTLRVSRDDLKGRVRHWTDLGFPGDYVISGRRIGCAGTRWKAASQGPDRTPLFPDDTSASPSMR